MDSSDGSSVNSDPSLRSVSEKESSTLDISFMIESINHIMASDSVYETLKVSDDATSGIGLSKKKIKDNFIKMARAIHPDKCLHSDAHAAFSKLRAAYEEINNDLNNPKPIAEPQPKVEPKQRRHVAAVTSRLLRGAAVDQSMAGAGGSDLTCLKRFCNQGKPAPFQATEADREARQMKNISGSSSTFSSATTPVDLFATISPKSKQSKTAPPRILDERLDDGVSSKGTSPLIYGLKKCRLTPSDNDHGSSIMLPPHDLAL